VGAALVSGERQAPYFTAPTTTGERLHNKEVLQLLEIKRSPYSWISMPWERDYCLLIVIKKISWTITRDLSTLIGKQAIDIWMVVSGTSNLS